MHPRVSCVLTLRERSSDACSATAEAPGQGRSARAPPVARAEAHATRACRCGAGVGDRKSTRLNSSHSQISYAVFCLKKKRLRLGKVTVADVLAAQPFFF